MVDPGTTQRDRERGSTNELLAATEVDRTMGDEDGTPVVPDTRVGRYVVLHIIGAGGMGAAYAAYDPDLDRKVALKLLHTSYDRDGVARTDQRRLIREAQAMARIDHPNVVAVHDAGDYEGRVFIAMEHIEGVTLGGWLAREQRSWREVTGMFVAAGRGLVAAHAAGLIHRDFKPANVMVADDGRVLVMDFGLARASGASSSRPSPAADVRTTHDEGDPDLTRTGAVVGTPAYMSPEQHRGLPPDERSDQFSFCVALWEALCGQRPFAGEDIPSYVFNVLEGDVAAMPQDLEIPDRLRRAVERGLARAPDDRHPSMNALLAELEHDPRAARRRLGLLAAGGVAVVALGFGLWSSSHAQAGLCRGAQNRLTGIWDQDRREAVQEAIEATKLAYAPETWQRVAASLDEWAAAWVAQRVEACEETRVHKRQAPQLMDLRMRCLDGRLRSLRALTEILASADATTVEHAVSSASSLPSVGACGDPNHVRAQVPPPDDPEVARRVEGLRIRLAESEMRRKAGEPRQGLALAEELATEAATLGYPPLVVEASYRLGLLRSAVLDATGAEQALSQAFFSATTAGMDELAQSAAIALVNVTGDQQARFDEGLEWARHAAAMVERTGDESERITLASGLGGIHERAGRYDEALEYHRQALATAEAHFGPRHSNIPSFANNVGNALHRLAAYDEALTHHRRALELWEEALGPNHPDVAFSLNNLGNTFYQLARYDEALAEHQRALEIRERALGSDNPLVADSLQNMANALDGLGRTDESLDVLKSSLAIRERALGPNHPDVGRALDLMGVTFTDRGDFSNARRFHLRAIALAERAYGPNHPAVAIIAVNLGLATNQLGQPGEARRHLSRSLSIFVASQGADHPLVGHALYGIGSCLRSQGRYAEALAYQHRALAIWERVHGPDHPEHAHALLEIAENHLALGHAPRARPYAERAVELRRSAPETERELAEQVLTRSRANRSGR